MSTTFPLLSSFSVILHKFWEVCMCIGHKKTLSHLKETVSYFSGFCLFRGTAQKDFFLCRSCCGKGEARPPAPAAGRAGTPSSFASALLPPRAALFSAAGQGKRTPSRQSGPRRHLLCRRAAKAQFIYTFLHAGRSPARAGAAAPPHVPRMVSAERRSIGAKGPKVRGQLCRQPAPLTLFMKIRTQRTGNALSLRKAPLPPE